MSIAHDALHEGPSTVRDRLTLDRVLGSAWRAWGRHRTRFLLVGLGSLLATLVADLVVASGFAALGNGALLLAPLRLVPLGMLWTGIAPRILDDLRGTRTPFDLRVACLLMLRSMLGCFVWAFLVGLGVMGLIVPGIVIAVLLYVLVPCLMFNRGKQASLNQAARMTRGYRGRLFVLGLTLCGLRVLIELLNRQVLTALGALVPWLGGGAVGVLTMVVAAAAASLLVGPVVVVTTTIVFHELSPRDPQADIDRVFG